MNRFQISWRRRVILEVEVMPQQDKKHRSRIELIASILGAAASVTEGELSTRIMYRVNTSQRDLKEYLQDLLNFELLEHDSNSRRYRITNRGSRFLLLYNRLTEELSVLE